MKRASCTSRVARFVHSGLGAALVWAVVMACGGDFAAEEPAPAPNDAGADHVDAHADVAVVEASAPDAAVEAAPPGSCNPRVEAHALVDSPHVPEGTAITYSSNPPASGPHYPIWAHFQEYTQPVDDGYLVHSMEHGAVLLLYRCDLASCPQAVDALRAVRDARPADLLCDAATRVRIILAPRPSLDVAVAAAAWGFTYEADCVDAGSIGQFVADHYGQGPESTCAPGKVF